MDQNGRCDYCHVVGTPGGTVGGDQSDFGKNFVGSGNDTSKAFSKWRAASQLNDDNDKQTNGEELGDPCGRWTMGGTPERTTDITDPSNAQEFTDLVSTEECVMGDSLGAGPATPHPEFEQGFCSLSTGGPGTPGTGNTPWLLLGAASALATLIVRRRYCVP